MYGNRVVKYSVIPKSKYKSQMPKVLTKEYLSDKEALWYEKPKNIVGTLVNPISGEVVSEKTDKATMFYYIKGTEPSYTNESLDNLIPTVKTE